MMDTIAQRLLESVSWGLKMRLYTGAGLSTLDLLSDLYMIYTYATTGQRGTAQSLGIMVGLCIGVQLWTVFNNTYKGPRRVMLKEMLIVLSGIAPGIHAMRVANGANQSEHAAMNPEIELVFVRCIEMVFESVPGTVLQTSTLLRSMKGNEGFSKVALGSIIVSALTTGFSTPSSRAAAVTAPAPTTPATSATCALPRTWSTPTARRSTTRPSETHSM